jgi:hypothetical protein
MASADAGPHVALFTAYTSDYAVGELCARVNRAYASRHGYGWVCQVGPPRGRGQEAPERHPTWDKVALLLELMQSLLEGKAPRGLSPRTTHLMWIDADAVVLRHDRKVEQILESLPAGARARGVHGPREERPRRQLRRRWAPAVRPRLSSPVAAQPEQLC